MPTSRAAGAAPEAGGGGVAFDGIDGRTELQP
jgi:hypothetical protein